MQWSEMPASVRGLIEDRFGAKVIEAASQAGGFSPGVAARVVLADGRRAFVKAVSATLNPDSPDIYRREAQVAAAMPASVPAPALHWSFDLGEWVVLAFEEVDGRPPELPWRADEFARVVDGLRDLADDLTPSPIALESASEALGRLFGGWEHVAIDAALAARFPAAVQDRIADLVELESGWSAAVAGETMVHLDVRADNLLLTADRVFVVDWPWAAVGAPWLDLVAMLPSVAMQGGPDPESVWSSYPLRRGVDDDRVDAFIAALAGFFMHRSVLPPPPGLPTLRPFQAGQGEQAFAWIARRRGW
jgi:hypothetical protein